jgi:FkbM family methyltransferase
LWSSLVDPMQTLREVSYSPRTLRLARRLHLSDILRKCYQWVTGGRKNVLCVNLGKFNVLFHVHDALDYRTTENYFIGYERDFLDALLSVMAAGDVLLDVGSSTGHFTIPIAKVVGNGGVVIAVEPQADARVQLEANLRLNGLSNVQVLGMALGDARKEGRLAWGDGSCPSLLAVSKQDQESVLTTAGSDGKDSQVVSVEVGDEVMVRERLPIPQAVKIDVEGFEFQVIRGLSATLSNASCRLLCCEIHPAALHGGTTPQIIIEEVKSLGFKEIVLTERLSQIHMIARKDRLTT